jgi:hypothetical protein
VKAARRGALRKNGRDSLQLHFGRTQRESKRERVVDVIANIGIENDVHELA